MKKIALVTDSTADLTPAQIKSLNVAVRPLNVIFSDKTYLDGVDISPQQFYPMLAEAKTLPTTSQPSPGEFMELYEKLFAQGYDTIISLHISSGLSGTYQAAKQAADHLGRDIRVVDSRSISVGTSVQVTAASEAIAAGQSVDEVILAIDASRANHEVVFTLNTLEYLAKGGRIGKAKSLLGSLLNIKPIIRVDDGVYIDAGKARSQKQALEQMVTLFQDLSKGRRAKRVCVAVGAADEAGQHLKGLLERAFGIEPSVSQVGPVVGVHTGPGTVGAAIEFFPKA
ncbi:MAG: DegV domain-containing protein [Firmicutes bacterium]|nr:DegV domain-containing protein [candidate division NPL-UPA2 bacterium]MBT9153858.1 DegV domain-containing protein [candidate division NPL-UPA2 bacterium]MBT9156470.1 DegV domain-containing protein [candidate division NPL-UPA2 bacterium]